MGKHRAGRGRPSVRSWPPRDPFRSVVTFPVVRMAVIGALAFAGVVTATGSVAQPPVVAASYDAPALCGAR